MCAAQIFSSRNLLKKNENIQPKGHITCHNPHDRERAEQPRTPAPAPLNCCRLSERRRAARSRLDGRLLQETQAGDRAPRARRRCRQESEPVNNVYAQERGGQNSKRSRHRGPGRCGCSCRSMGGRLCKLYLLYPSPYHFTVYRNP